MIVIVYLLAVLGFGIGAWVILLLLTPIGWIYRRITGELIYPQHPIFVAQVILAAIITMDITRHCMAKWGYSPGLLLYAILIPIYLFNGSHSEANAANKVQAYGTVLGLIMYGTMVLLGWR